MPSRKKPGKARKIALNQQQMNFCQLVVGGMEPQEAYLSAYPACSRESATSSACRLLSDARVQEYLRKIDDYACASIGLTTSKILKELSVIGFSDIRDYLDVVNGGVFLKDFSQLPAPLTRAISSVESIPTKHGPAIKIKLHPKQPALETLGKHTGMFSDINQAFTVLRRYGFKIKETETGYELLDDSQEQPSDEMFEDAP